MKRINYIAMVFVALIAFSGCKKQLELQPTDTFSDANAFLTIKDIQLGAHEAYLRYGNAYINDIYVSALLSDEARLGIDNAGQGAITYRYQFNSDNTAGGDVIGAFGAYYRLIDQVNRVLSFVPTVTATTEEEPRRNILKAQLLALRGIGHFGLLQSYSKNYNPTDPNGIPLMLKSDALGKPSRNTMGEVMTQIEADLNEAKGLLPNETAGSFKDTVMNKVNIAAYQARIALYKKDYAGAITYSTEVIKSLVKPLVSGTDFNGIWSDANSFESLFRIRYSNSTALGALWTTTGGQIYVGPSDKLVASYSADDIRRNAYIGTSGGNNYVKKHFNSARGGRVVDLKASRIAEMYLIRAEAYAKSATPDLALGGADLNTLRKARITDYVDETFGSAAELTTAVLEERFKELAFEGFRFWDLKRNDLPVQRAASDANPAWQNLPVGSNRFVLPIPRGEILLNPNIAQNDGY